MPLSSRTQLLAFGLGLMTLLISPVYATTSNTTSTPEQLTFEDLTTEEGELSIFTTTLIAVSITTSTSTTVPTTTTPNTVSLNEIMSNPSEGVEWIELYNYGDSTVDLNGWVLCDARTIRCTLATLDHLLAPHEWLVINMSSNYLNNTGDRVTLTDAYGVLVDEVTYGSGVLSAPPKGQALARVTDGKTGAWEITIEPTPNKANLFKASEPVKQTTSKTSSGTSGAGNILNSTTTNVPVATSATNKTPTPSPSPIKWTENFPMLVEAHKYTQLSVNGTADQHGGHIFFSWNIASNTYEGSDIIHQFTNEGVIPVVIHATSTSGVTSTKEIAITVARRTKTPIHITEIYPGDNHYSEFIEIHNQSTSTIDISSWVLAVTPHYVFAFPPSTTIPGGDYRVLYKKATGITLNNNGATIYLLSTTTTLADAVTYEKMPGDASFHPDIWYAPWAAPNPGIPSFPAEITIASVLGARVTTTKESKVEPIKTVLHNQLTTINAARQYKKGTTASVQGRVSALPNTFGTQYFYLEDDTGGMQIFRQKKDFPFLKIGQEIQVNGIISILNGIPRINAAQIIPLGEQVFTTTSSTIAEIAAHLGKLVTVQGEITKRQTAQLYIDDNEAELLITIKKNTKITTGELEPGITVRITSVVEQTNQGIELWPRNQADIQINMKTLPIDKTKKSEPLPKSKRLVFFLTGLFITVTGISIYKNKKTSV